MVAAGGSRGAFGIFFTPMADDLGWSSAEMSGTFSISMIIEGIMSIVSGRLSDKYGAKVVLLSSGLISGVGFSLVSLVNNLWQMYLIYGIAIGVGLGGIVIPVVTSLAKWFTANRTLMTGIAMAANGFGQLIMPLISYRLIANYDWRISYIIFGMIVFALIFVPALFLKKKQTRDVTLEQDTPPSFKKAIKREVDDLSLKEAMRTRLFWMIIFMLGVYGYCFLSLLVHIAPHAIEIGLSAATASTILSLMGGALLVGRLGFGALADRIGNKKSILIGFISILISLIWLIQATETWELYLFAIIFSLGLGSISSSQSPMVADFFGLKFHGTIFGAIGGGTVALGALGPLITGYLFDITGHYQVAFIVCAVLISLGLITNLLLKPVRLRR
jgi:MFS family permease